jgi:hypothetical protein
MLALGATLANRYLGTSLPENPDDYAISYHGIPLSTAEIQVAVDRVTRLVQAGLMSKPMALQEVYPNLSAVDAQRLADELDSDETKAEVDMPDEPTAEVEAADAAAAPAAAAPTDAATAAVVASGASVADTALNGAQVTALVELLAQISAGTLAPEAAILVLVAAYPTIDEATARRIVSAQATVAPPAVATVVA